MTGSKGIGKTTLCETLLEGCPVPGVRSYALRGPDGLPRTIVMEERTGPGRCTIGRRTAHGMEADTAALDTTGAAFLRAARLAEGEWAAVDEIGFLEEGSAHYREELLRLFGTKRVLAVLRKADTPLLHTLRTRPDVLVLDLDEPGWANTDD